MSEVSLMELYLTDDKFRAYVDKYAACHRMPPENAIKCMVVREYAKYMKGAKNGTNEL